MLYAVCTRCTFLRAFSRGADRTRALTECPACGAELVVQQRAGRFEPTYVARLTHFMNGARARGMKVVATLWSTPCWSSSAPASIKQGCAG